MDIITTSLPRLLPPIAVVVALLATVSGLLVGGPVSQGYHTYYLKGCRHSWWMDVSFVSNLVYPYLDQMAGKGNEAANVSVTSISLNSIFLLIVSPFCIRGPECHCNRLLTHLCPKSDSSHVPKQ